MSNQTEPSHSKSPDIEPIFIVFSGLSGRYDSIRLAYNYQQPATEWCVDEIQRTIKSDRSTFTNSLNSKTIEKFTEARDDDEKLTRYGFTVVEKVLTLPGPEDLPKGKSNVHIVCDERTLDVSYVSTEHEDARKVCEGQTGSVVKKVEYVREAEWNAIRPTVFTIDGKPYKPGG
ncbi:MAG: hypothetical protein Q9180_007114 [Flavoplaca navasiana]